MPGYSGYKVVKVQSINPETNTITGTIITGGLDLTTVTSPVKVTFIKATDLEVGVTGTGSSFEIDFNYRNKF